MKVRGWRGVLFWLWGWGGGGGFFVMGSFGFSLGPFGEFKEGEKGWGGGLGRGVRE